MSEYETGEPSPQAVWRGSWVMGFGLSRPRPIYSSFVGISFAAKKARFKMTDIKREDCSNYSNSDSDLPEKCREIPKSALRMRCLSSRKEETQAIKLRRQDLSDIQIRYNKIAERCSFSKFYYVSRWPIYVRAAYTPYMAAGFLRWLRYTSIELCRIVFKVSLAHHASHHLFPTL